MAGDTGQAVICCACLLKTVFIVVLVSLDLLQMARSAVALAEPQPPLTDIV